MTPRDRAKALLVAEEGFTPRQADWWLDDDASLGTMLHVLRSRRATALSMHGLVETAKSERAGRMISALLAVAGGA